MTVNLTREIAIEAPTKINRTVIIDWQPSSYFGWGIYGMNLMLNWAIQQTESVVSNAPIEESSMNLNPIEWARIGRAIEQSRNLQLQLKPFEGQTVSTDLPVLHALGNEFIASAASGVRLLGKPNIGLIFFEYTDFSNDRRERAKSFSLIVAGSTWNRELLDEAQIGPSVLVTQGIDATTFHPAPKAGWFADRFAIFSGGKLEYRKGQDLVLKAFRAFAERHPDALLVTAWASPWPGAAASINADPALAPISLLPDGRLDVKGWAFANGIAPDKVIDLGALPNSAMPRLYREMDVGLFPNRCEGGTNLVAMECMACAVPVILSRNTGHLDLISPDRCFSLSRQFPISGVDHLGWGESDVEEMVETLEAVRRDKVTSQVRGDCGAQFMSRMTWSNTVKRLSNVIAPYL